MNQTKKCHRIQIPETCCYLTFGKGSYHESEELYETIRGEEMIIDFDKNGKVLGIELLSGKNEKKQCGC